MTTNRTVVAHVSLSLDGRVAGRGGPYDMGWIAPHAITGGARDHMLRVTRPATTVLLGRNNYEGFSGFWPSVVDNPDADPVTAVKELREQDGGGENMIERMDNVGIVVEDLEATIAFFVELGMELEGQATVEGPSVDQLVGLDGVRCDIAMVRTPDGHGRLELMRFQSPPAVGVARDAPVNALGLRRILFAVKDIDDVVARLLAHGAELIGEVGRIENSYRMGYLRGPEGIIVALAENLG